MAISIDERSAPGLAGLMLAQIDAGLMPPWVPGPLSAPFSWQRAIAPSEVAVLREWAERRAIGDPHDYRPPAPTMPRWQADSPPDWSTLAAEAYESPKTSSDEQRCFLLPALLHSGYLRGYQMLLGDDRTIYHHAGAQLVSASTAAMVRSDLDGKDGRPGWDCGGGVPSYLVNLTQTSTEVGFGYYYPAGWGAQVPEGAAVVLNLHYQPLRQKAPDRPGMNLWFYRDGAAPRAVASTSVAAPSEVPCPTGVALDPRDPCSRAYAVAHAKWAGSPAISEGVVKGCGGSLEDYKALTPNSREEHFYVSGVCEGTIGATGTLFTVSGHAHPNAVSLRVELQEPDGAWKILLDAPRFRWGWASIYQLAQPLEVHADQRVRLKCVYDNGFANQPAAATHEYGFDGPAVPPLDPPRYQIWDLGKNDSMCYGNFEVMQ